MCFYRTLTFIIYKVLHIQLAQSCCTVFKKTGLVGLGVTGNTLSAKNFVGNVTYCEYQLGKWDGRPAL